MPVRTWVGRFCVVEGRVTEEGPWLGSLIRQRPDEEADELYVLIEPANRGSVEYTSQLVDVISQLYSKDPLSLTGALTRSLRAAHDHLREWNRHSLKEHRVGAGASCLALRHTDAYLAQVGPSVAYVLSAGGEFRRYDPDDTSFEGSLGIAERFEPGLRRIPLQPGDLVLLASSHIDDIATADHIRRVLAKGADDALPELYLLCRDEPNIALIMLSCFEEPEEEAPPEFLLREPPPLDDADAAAAGAGETGPSAESAPAPVLLAEPPVRAPVSASASIGASEGSLPPHAINQHVREITASAAPPPLAGVRIRGDSSTPRYKRSTGMLPVPQLRIPKLAVFAALTLALLGIVAYCQLPGSVRESREAKFDTLIAGARDANARAQATGDAGLKRQLLGEAQSKLDDAAKIHDDDGTLLALQADVTAALGVLDQVVEVREFTTVVDLAQQVTGTLTVTHTVTGGGNAFFVDAKGKRVLRVPLAGGAAPETIMQEGEPAGFVTAGRPALIAWAEQTQSLLILDDQRQAFVYFPDRGALPMTVRGADGWGSLDAIAASSGNLYVLDVNGAQVWRYLPGQGGFDSERTGLLDGADLSSATEIAVGEDVYVLDERAGIRRFEGKTERPFPLAGIDRPLAQPASLSVLRGSNRLVVADRGNKRIVVASATGEFMKQIVSTSFTDLRAVAVDEGTNTLYVLNGDTLLQAPYPP